MDQHVNESNESVYLNSMRNPILWDVNQYY